MIESLTEEQKAQLPFYVDKWLKIGLATGPVDLENAKKAVCLAYKAANLSEPTKFYHATGPIDAIRIIQELDPSLTKKEIFESMIHGAHDAFWLSFYDCVKEVLKLDCYEPLIGLIELAKYSGWLNVYEDVVVFQDRPEYIKFDNEKRLHCDSGPAIRYTDGFAVYVWHGTSIPAEWIDNKDTMDVSIALTWPNVEQRRCACEILGWKKVIDTLKSTVIDEDNDPEVGTLLEIDLPEIGKEKFLRVMCGTKREFVLPVPPSMKTALQANAWTFGVEDVMSFLKPEVRT
jgi:hypothetical protein